ncbi:hypothetical protein E2C01_045115 [Portunus trituberculatus]|uniref:Uncharacterized protein n=1 Tax=Portunus trituberculatus TaxID=210409 RepID=A0A5B7FU22_PORTR|nr:hypothetical protein [Portunus trituberculatus]
MFLHALNLREALVGGRRTAPDKAELPVHWCDSAVGVTADSDTRAHVVKTSVNRGGSPGPWKLIEAFQHKVKDTHVSPDVWRDHLWSGAKQESKAGKHQGLEAVVKLIMRRHLNEKCLAACTSSLVMSLRHTTPARLNTVPPPGGRHGLCRSGHNKPVLPHC